MESSSLQPVVTEMELPRCSAMSAADTKPMGTSFHAARTRTQVVGWCGAARSPRTQWATAPSRRPCGCCRAGSALLRRGPWLACLLELLDLGLAQALDGQQLLLGRVRDGVDGEDAAIGQLLDVRGRDALLLHAQGRARSLLSVCCRPRHAPRRPGDTRAAARGAAVRAPAGGTCSMPTCRGPAISSSAACSSCPVCACCSIMAAISSCQMCCEDGGGGRAASAVEWLSFSAFVCMRGRGEVLPSTTPRGEVLPRRTAPRRPQRAAWTARNLAEIFPRHVHGRGGGRPARRSGRARARPGGREAAAAGATVFFLHTVQLRQA